MMVDQEELLWDHLYEAYGDKLTHLDLLRAKLSHIPSVPVLILVFLTTPTTLLHKPP